MRFAAVAVTVVLAFVVALAAHGGDTDRQKVDRIFAAYDNAGSPGCALGVIRNGDFIYRRGYGMGSLELNVPLTPESVFYMGSVSKEFTAASVVLAAEQGFLSLDDNVRKYIPELPDYGHPITLRQMLHHTSGLRDFLTLVDLSGQHQADLHSKDEFIDLIARQKNLNNIPGDEYIYSNTNYFLLGEVVTRATKKSLNDFATENIFKPLGMSHTRFYDDHTFVLPGRVAAYQPGSNGSFLVDWSTNYEAVGAGGLMSSVDDLLFWDRNFYENKLGKGTLLKELQTRGVLNNGKQIGYALGLELGTYRGLPTVEHGGALFGYRTEILRFPDQRFSVVCLCNFATANGSAFARRIADVYLEKSLQPETKSPDRSAGTSSPDPAPFIGRYLDTRTHSIYSFTVSNGSLMAWGVKLQRIGPNQFRDLGTGIITFEQVGGSMRVTLDLDDQPFFSGNRVEELRLGDAALAEFSGSYRSAELDATYRLSVKNGSLDLRTNWNQPIKLHPIVTDEFESEDLGTLVFHRDANHRVSGFSVFAGRVRDVGFEKTD
jgi:CubicO group peptidase (beta-lactamase class C family)